MSQKQMALLKRDSWKEKCICALFGSLYMERSMEDVFLLFFMFDITQYCVQRDKKYNSYSYIKEAEKWTHFSNTTHKALVLFIPV